MILGHFSGKVTAYILKNVVLRHDTRMLELSSFILVMYYPFFALQTKKMHKIGEKTN